jgi:hypothetical protein
MTTHKQDVLEELRFRREIGRKESSKTEMTMYLIGYYGGKVDAYNEAMKLVEKMNDV